MMKDSNTSMFISRDAVKDPEEHWESKIQT